MADTKFHDDEIMVQTLKPPLFEPTGIVVDRRVAWEKGLWYQTINLWVVQSKPVPSVVYQQRSPNVGWAPGKLDVLIAGHCENLQTPQEAIIMESSEEMSVVYDQSSLVSLGRKLSVGVGQDGTVRNSVVNIYMVEDNLPITRFTQQKKEVYAVVSLPISELLKVHSDPEYNFVTQAIKNDGQTIDINIEQNIFPPNWDPYHYKMALLIDRYFKGERNLKY